MQENNTGITYSDARIMYERVDIRNNTHRILMHAMSINVWGVPTIGTIKALIQNAPIEEPNKSKAYMRPVFCAGA